MPSSKKLSPKEIDALLRLRDVVREHHVTLKNSLRQTAQGEAPFVLKKPISAILAALAECE
jgi:hypothetical protein